jgi:hypothetical protein
MPDADLNEQWEGGRIRKEKPLEAQSENQSDIQRDKWTPLIFVMRVLLPWSASSTIGDEPVQLSIVDTLSRANNQEAATTNQTIKGLKRYFRTLTKDTKTQTVSARNANSKSTLL